MWHNFFPYRECNVTQFPPYQECNVTQFFPYQECNMTQFFPYQECNLSKLCLQLGSDLALIILCMSKCKIVT